MAIQLTIKNGGKTLEARVSGKLKAEDYQEFLPTFERLLQDHGKISLLFDMEDFHGWEGGALWEDIKLDAKHFSDIDRLAMVGDKQWEKGMSFFCKPFTTATIRYFDHSAIDTARVWLQMGDELKPIPVGA